MTRWRRRLADAGLVVLAVVVLAGAAEAALRTPSPSSSFPTVAQRLPSPTPSALPVQLPTPQPSAQRPSYGRVLLVGPDLVPLGRPLAELLGATVTTAAGSGASVVTAAGLQAVTGTPAVVVLQVRAGSQTTTRTAAALALVRGRFPAARLVVVGPLDPGDDLSRAAVKAAVARVPGVLFVDAYADGWHTEGAAARARSLAGDLGKGLRTP